MQHDEPEEPQAVISFDEYVNKTARLVELLAEKREIEQWLIDHAYDIQKIKTQLSVTT